MDGCVVRQLEQVAKSYDVAIELGREGIDLYRNLPASITNDPDYLVYQKLEAENSLSDSGGVQIKEFLAPKAEMSFVDLGCCLNLMFRGYAKWPSRYFGVDISMETIRLLKDFTDSEKLSVGALRCCSVHDTLFEADFFDIGACIGVLEYFQKDFIAASLIEMHRIMKPAGRLVLDVPDLGSPECRIAMMIEEYLGRTDLYDLSSEAFENLLLPYFKIEKKEKVGAMIQYFLECDV